MPERDRDERGRALSARPRDSLGRPLPYGAEGVAEDPELVQLASADDETLIVAAQDLIDARRPFEAHELLEAAWKRAPEPERPLWRALAQLTVGLTHRLRGNATGAAALFTRSALALESLDSQGQSAAASHRVDVSGLAEAAHALAAGQEHSVRLRA